MGQKDLSEKRLVAFDDVFADIVNVLLFGGRSVIRPEELEDKGSRSIYKDGAMLREMDRDVVKRWKQGEVRFACIGVENQTTVDQDMPLRVIGYDGAAYRAQLAEPGNGKERYPVITLVLYFGYGKHWDKAVTLLDRVTVPEGLDSYVNDYRVNLFEVAYLSEEQVAMFQSDFKIVVDYFVQKRKNHDYKPPETEIRHVEAVLQLLSAMERDDRFENAVYKKDGKKVENMCDVLDVVENRGIEIGEQRGIKIGERQGIEKNRRETATRLSEMGLSVDQIAKAVEMNEGVVRIWLDENLNPIK